MSAVIYSKTITAPDCFYLCFFFSLVLLWERFWLILILKCLHYFMQSVSLIPLNAIFFILLKEKEQNIPKDISKCQLYIFAIIAVMFHDCGMFHQICMVMWYVTTSFKLILCTKHIVFSTMYGISFYILTKKLYQKC